MNVHFRVNEEKTFQRLLTMRECIAEQELHAEPCPLLAGQLNELAVFAEKLLELVRKLQQSPWVNDRS